MNTIAILKCRLVNNDHDTPKILDFKVYDTLDSAISKMEWILSNIKANPANAKKVGYINNGHGISFKLTDEPFPRQEWVAYLEAVRTW